MVVHSGGRKGNWGGWYRRSEATGKVRLSVEGGGGGPDPHKVKEGEQKLRQSWVGIRTSWPEVLLPFLNSHYY